MTLTDPYEIAKYIKNAEKMTLSKHMSKET